MLNKPLFSVLMGSDCYCWATAIIDERFEFLRGRAYISKNRPRVSYIIEITDFEYQNELWLILNPEIKAAIDYFKSCRNIRG